MKRIIKVLLAWLTISYAALANEKAELLGAYFRVLLVQQVPEQARPICGQMAPQDAAQVQEVLAAWTQTRTAVIRQNLTDKFGSNTREVFEQLATQYSAAENQNDAQFLQKLATELDLKNEVGGSYANLRRAVAAKWLQEDIQSASQLLSNLQTWIKLRATTPDVPPLQAWLSRDQKVTAPVTGQEVDPPPSPDQLLASAEVGAGEFKAPATDENAPRNLYAEARKKRQSRRLEESQAAMQQVANERQSAEQEYASKKQAEAQAEAEAVRGQAQKLAAVEKQTIEQQQNSWSSKLKSIVGATVTAAGGAFLGGVGAQAGQMASNVLFQ